MKNLVAFAALALAGTLGLGQLVGPPASAPGSQPSNTALQASLRDRARHLDILKQAEGKKYDVAFLGDSITHWFDKDLWAKHYEPLKAGNFGSAGDRTGNLLWRITQGKELEGQTPRVFVVMIGVNNLWASGNTPEEIVDGVGAIVATLRERFPQAKVLVLGVLPTEPDPQAEIRRRVKAINMGLSRLRDGRSVRFLDFGQKMLAADGSIPKDIMKDGLHPTPKGYQVWLDNVNPVLLEMLGQPASQPTSQKTNS
jgi:lysophospholipase L1-like esterase